MAGMEAEEAGWRQRRKRKEEAKGAGRRQAGGRSGGRCPVPRQENEVRRAAMEVRRLEDLLDMAMDDLYDKRLALNNCREGQSRARQSAPAA